MLGNSTFLDGKYHDIRMIFMHFPLKELLKGLIVFSKSTSVWCLQKIRERRVFEVQRQAVAKSKVQYHILPEKNQELLETPTNSRNNRIFFCNNYVTK